jgi:hypothetical protein
VIIGGSAGGLGIFLGIDAMADLIRSRVDKVHGVDGVGGVGKVIVRGVPDSGFFLQYSSNNTTPLTHLAEGRDEAFSNQTGMYHNNRHNYTHIY